MRKVATLYRKFESLPEEKKKRILDACIEEFSQNSYDNASTNNIVQRAGISKGILFHYFGSKKNLFLYVFDYILDYVTGYIMKRLKEELADPQFDIFERIMKSGLLKIQIANEYPAMYAVLFNAVHVPDALQKEIQARYEKIYKNFMALFLNDIGTSKFRKDIDRDKAIELIFFALEGVSNKYMKIFKSMTANEIFSKMESVAEEYYEYIDILKGGIYRTDIKS